MAAPNKARSHQSSHTAHSGHGNVMVVNADAETVLQTQSVEQARAQEKRKRAAVEQKKNELRELVGSSYRDVISSADNILEMNTKAKEIREKIQKMGLVVNELFEKELQGESAKFKATALKEQAERYGHLSSHLLMEECVLV